MDERLEPSNSAFLYRYPKNRRMAKHLVDMTGCVNAYQKRSEELAAILWIQLKIIGSCRRGHKQLVLSLALTTSPAMIPGSP